MRTTTAVAILLLTAAIVHSADAPYQGLIREFRATDHVILFEAEEVSATDVGGRFLVRGKIAAVYQGSLKTGNPLEFELSPQELTDRKDQPSATDFFLFRSLIRKNETAVLLLNGADDYRVVNVLSPHPYLAEYVAASQGKTDSDVLVKLTSIYLKWTFKPIRHIATPIALIQDLKRFGAKVETRDELLTGLAKEYRETILESLDGNGYQHLTALWLGSYLPEQDRKEMVRRELKLYDKRLRELDEILKERRALVTRPTEEKSLAGEPAPDPLDFAIASANAVPRYAYVLIDTSWHSRWCDIQEGGLLLPLEALQQKELPSDTVLRRVQAFANEP